jgi:hypothetical protein
LEDENHSVSASLASNNLDSWRKIPITLIVGSMSVMA